MNRSIQPEIQELKDFNVLPPTRTTLPNGIPLTVINAGEQEVVRIDIVFAGGRWQQSHRLQALFANRMLREGSQKYVASEIAEKLDYYGAWLELSCSSEHSCITLYSLNKYIAETIEVLESLVKEPLFPEKELGTVIDANIQQYLVNATKVNFIAQRSLLATLYGDKHPCGSLIEEADYRNIHPAMLREFYDAYYHSDNCFIFLAGKVTDDVVQRIEAAFGTSPFGVGGRKAARVDYPIFTLPEKRIFTERNDAMQSGVKLGAITLTRQHPDYFKFKVLTTLFGGYFGSRLMSNIREDKGYTYGISVGTAFYPGTGMYFISTEADNEYVEPLIKEIYHEIDRLHRDLVSEAELATVRNYMLGEMCRNYESSFSLSDAWMFILMSDLDDDYFVRSLRAVQEITPDEIRELARRYFCKETLKEVIAGKKMT